MLQLGKSFLLSSNPAMLIHRMNDKPWSPSLSEGDVGGVCVRVCTWGGAGGQSQKGKFSFPFRNGIFFQFSRPPFVNSVIEGRKNSQPLGGTLDIVPFMEKKPFIV